MRRIWAILAAVLLSTSAWADDEIPLDQVPDAARKTIQDHVADGTIEEIDKDVEAGRTVYEVEYRDASGREYELKVAEDGSLLAKRRD